MLTIILQHNRRSRLVSEVDVAAAFDLRHDRQTHEIHCGEQREQDPTRGDLTEDEFVEQRKDTDRDWPSASRSFLPRRSSFRRVNTLAL